MEPANILEVVVAVLGANILTIGWLYCLWRIKKNENDTPAIIGFLAVCGIALFILYASTTK